MRSAGTYLFNDKTDAIRLRRELFKNLFKNTFITTQYFVPQVFLEAFMLNQVGLTDFKVLHEVDKKSRVK